MYVMTGNLSAKPGQHGQLTKILLQASELVRKMPGCRAYLILEDIKDENIVSVFEAWDDKDSHDTSLQNEDVRALIAEAMPLLSGPPSGVEFRLVGGYGMDIETSS